MVIEHKIPLFHQWIAPTFAVALLSISGCASTSIISPEEQIRALEKEVSRLKSERANLEARAGSLDDKILLMETKLKKCGPESSLPGLAVVRLKPSDIAFSEQESGDGQPEEGAEDYGDSADEEVAAKKGKGRKKRPVLVLNERNFAQPMAGTNPKPVDNLTVSTKFDQLGADNLGVVSSGRSLEPSGDAFSSQAEGLPPTESTEMALFNNAYREYSNKRLDAALNGFAEFVKVYPNHSFADDALYWRGECYLAQGKFLYAIGELQRLTRRYPASDKVSSALYRIGFAYDKLRDYGKAAEYYFEVVDKFPGSEAARRASSRTAELKNSAQAGGPLMPTFGVAVSGVAASGVAASGATASGTR